MGGVVTCTGCTGVCCVVFVCCWVVGCVVVFVGFYIMFRVGYYWGYICYLRVFSYFNLSLFFVCGKFIYFMSVCCICFMVFVGSEVIPFVGCVCGLLVVVLG